MSCVLTDGESLISEAEASHVCKTSGRNNKSGRTRIRDNLSARDMRPAYVFGEAPRSSRAQGKPGSAGESEVIHNRNNGLVMTFGHRPIQLPSLFSVGAVSGELCV